MVEALLDSSIVIDLLRQYAPALERISATSDLAVTPIVWLEVLQGAPDKSAQHKAHKLLNAFGLVQFENADYEWAIRTIAQFRLSHGVGALDVLIAAPAARLKVPLYTRNLRHFKPLLGALAQSPYA